MKVNCCHILIIAVSLSFCAGLAACSDNSRKEEKPSISQQQEELGHQAAEAVKQPMEQAEQARKLVEEKQKAALEGC